MTALVGSRLRPALILALLTLVLLLLTTAFLLVFRTVLVCVVLGCLVHDSLH
ncbi:MAG: hypothetical protein ACXIVO_08770 [Glycocaulis sp.]